ncbi:MAG TPA: LytTR family transcriptional regulator DNA-binding domain-containing protein [Saprospiraceae bacterium]|nr:LytTR family transcriptional regulator DNA-binding domain-containing protein [Saprospiraceae bacterium]
MMRAIVADADHASREALRGQVDAICPQVSVEGAANSAESAKQLMDEIRPELVFIDEGLIEWPHAEQWSPKGQFFELILLTSQPAFRKEALQLDTTAYLFKPVSDRELASAIHQSLHSIQLARDYRENREMLIKVIHHELPQEMISIPTMEGVEFLRLDEIVRCEGLQGFTRIVIEEQESFLSSYNIGEFRKLLEPFGFFCPHKSHLINPQHLRKFKMEGTIVMRDGSCVPVARRRRLEFLERVRRL